MYYTIEEINKAISQILHLSYNKINKIKKSIITLQN